MAIDSSATAREHTPHAKRTTRTATIIDALKRRAQAVLSDRSIDAESRAIIRYALETNDPWLAKLVKRAETGEDIVNSLHTIENSDNAMENCDDAINNCDDELLRS